MAGDSIALHSGVALDATAGGVIPINTQFASALGIDINVTAITGGASPTITFFVERIDGYGAPFAIWSPTAVAAPGKLSANISPYNPTAAQNAVLGTACQLRWTFGGATPPTSVTWSATAYPQR